MGWRDAVMRLEKEGDMVRLAWEGVMVRLNWNGPDDVMFDVSVVFFVFYYGFKLLLIDTIYIYAGYLIFGYVKSIGPI